MSRGDGSRCDAGRRGRGRGLPGRGGRRAGLDRQARVLYCLGLRAEESPGRARRPVFAVDAAASSGVREVTTWHPILHWTSRQVWDRIRSSGVRHHWAYDAGMSRLSCSFCVLGSRADLVCAAWLRPELAARYAEMEERFGHSFRADLAMSEVIAEAALT